MIIMSDFYETIAKIEPRSRLERRSDDRTTTNRLASLRAWGQSKGLEEDTVSIYSLHEFRDPPDQNSAIFNDIPGTLSLNCILP